MTIDTYGKPTEYWHTLVLQTLTYYKHQLDENVYI